MFPIYHFNISFLFNILNLVQFISLVGIKNILEERGIELKGLSIAEERLVTHIISAERIVEKELEKGVNGKFAEEITAKINVSREEVNKIFEKEEYQSKVIEILEREQERFEKEIEAIEEEEVKDQLRNLGYL